MEKIGWIENCLRIALSSEVNGGSQKCIEHRTRSVLFFAGKIFFVCDKNEALVQSDLHIFRSSPFMAKNSIGRNDDDDTTLDAKEHVTTQ